MGRPRRHPPVAAIAGSDPTVGDPSISKPPTSGGKRSASRKRQRRKRKGSTSTPADSIPSTDPSLTNHEEEILVLLETPSGFAIFGFKEYCLNQQNAMENIWSIFGEEFRSREVVSLKEFKIFKDKSSAINHATGVSEELMKMISCHYSRDQTLAVGKPEYKKIIERSSLRVRCRFDEAVLEVMWGLKNLMHCLVPQEELKLTKEERLPMSQGLKMFLNKHGFDVKPELVKEDVVVAACLLLDAELIEKRHFEKLRWARDKLKDVSGINSHGWDMMKVATALKIVFDPFEITDYDLEMFDGAEVSTLERDAHRYVGIIHEVNSLKIYYELVEMREVKKDALQVLGFWFS